MSVIKQRLEELASLEAGWLDGDGDKIEVNIDNAILVIETLMDAGIPRPGIFPNPQGFVQLEWLDGMEIVLPQ